MFSAKTEYGLVALIELAAAYPTGEQMLTALRKGGYLVSVRGPKGGCQLTRSPELISVAEVEECLEGAPHAERQGDRGHAEFRVLDGLAERAQ